MVKIESPFHGAVLNYRHGKQTTNGLTIEVTGEAPLWDRVTINGVEAKRTGLRFSAETTLTQKENEILAVSQGPQGEKQHSVRVIWDRHSRPRYQFSMDDNSFFLRDLAQKRYSSVFDCHYLKILKDLHKKYGTKFVLNCYYTTGPDFSLPQMPDTYKGEWRDNADWLRLSFHAYSDKPDRIYHYASAEKVASDYDLVASEIVRFAGEETWTTPTVIHWAMMQRDVLPALAERGVKVLTTLPTPMGFHYELDYAMDNLRAEYLSRHDAIMDFEIGIIFTRVDIVCNLVPIPNIIPTLQPLADDPNNAEIMDLYTHEQYFWDFYEAHLPDHAERLDATIRFVTDKGYEPVFFHEGLLGVEEP